ncbi:MAG TPA: AAA family ATPase [Balneola sp.]|nr:AAA family ATPase [Balneola sp.]
MRAEFTKRLFKAIAKDSTQEALQLCKEFVKEERLKGHNNLAEQLTKILHQTMPVSKSRKNLSSIPARIYSANVTELPRSKRNNEELATRIDYEHLRHHMILSSEVEARFSAIESEYAARERLARHGLNNKKKILLYGPPGCGKTLGAERLAFNTGMPLIKVKFDAIISSYFGDSAANLRTIFDGVSNSPCVLLLDECDFIAKSRDVRNDVGEIPRIVNMLLTLLEEFSAPGLLVATTNLEKNLDSALFRRFDDVIEVPPPGEEESKKLLQSRLLTLKVSKNIPWEKLARELNGRSAATFVKVSEQAAKFAVLENREIVQKEDIEKSTLEVYQKY